LLLTLREARRATEAAIQSTKAARDTLTETKKSFRLDQRPWVGLDQIDIPDKPTAGSAFRIKVSLRNSGKSPALRSDGEGTLYPVVIMEGDERVPLVDMTFSPKCANPKLQWDQNPSGGLILPEAKGISLSLSTPILEEKVVEKIMNERRISYLERKELDNERSGALIFMSAPPEYRGDLDRMWAVRIFFAGCIDYFDQFHEPHRTYFCLYYSPSLPNAGFSPCKKGNEAD
jgi:hypothetical protein